LCASRTMPKEISLFIFTVHTAEHLSMVGLRM
jgi:hypothetical protein